MAAARCSWFMRLTCSKYTLKSLPMPRTSLTCSSETCSFFCAAMAMAVLTALRICRPFRFPFFSMSSPTCFKMALFSASPIFSSFTDIAQTFIWLSAWSSGSPRVMWMRLWNASSREPGRLVVRKRTPSKYYCPRKKMDT